MKNTGSLPLPRKSTPTAPTCSETLAKTFNNRWRCRYPYGPLASVWGMPGFPQSPQASSMKQRTQGGRLRFHKTAVSSITLAELVSLVEKSRLPFWAYQELTQALADPEHAFTEAAFTAAIVQSMRKVPRAEVPDMPDRMIAATAVVFDVQVLSRDRRILSANLRTIWERGRGGVDT